MVDFRHTKAPGSDRPLQFAQRVSAETSGEPLPRRPWKLLIVDDDEEVHSLTRLVLRSYEFDGRGLELLGAYSAATARKVLEKHPDIAVILLDVVMEQEDSGLRLVRHIRGQLKNAAVRIVLRTGQPGQAPEMDVVAQYDINDYKAKIDLTARQLFTTVTGALRAWRDIQTIEKSRQGLQKVVEASNRLFNWQSRSQFAQTVLWDLAALADASTATNGGGPPQSVSCLVARRTGGVFCVIDGYGEYASTTGQRVNDVVPDHTGLMVCRASRRGEGLFFNHSYVCCVQADNGEEILFLVVGGRQLRAVDRNLVHVYMTNVATSFQNVNLNLEIIEGQKELIEALGGVLETRSLETAHHVLRVGEMAELLALKAGLSAQQATILRVAAPLHDVGKVGIPDAILNKPGKLTAAEYTIMKTHAAKGQELLACSDQPLMRAAAVIAAEHHERWDGTGYPRGLQGEEIHIYGRVTALVDVFDAMINCRVYRPAMTMGKVLGEIRAGRGTQFDPALVDVFLDHLTEFVAIVRAHPEHLATALGGCTSAREHEA